jgi:putative ABC transport system permease protein
MDGGGYVIRTRSDDAGMAQAISKVVADQDPRIQRVGVRPLDFVVERSLGSRRGAIRLVGAFGGLALLLTAVGVYGIVAFRASQRSREMAIRVALGASQGEIRNLVLGYGLRLAAGGTAIGLTVFGIASPVWKGRFFGVRPVDPMTIAGVAAVVLVVALGASLAPSRRASRAAPAELLREG